MIELRVHLVTSQGERVWADCRLELLPEVAGAAALRISASLNILAAGNVARLADGEVAVYLGSQFGRDALEGWRGRLCGLHDAVTLVVVVEYECRWHQKRFKIVEWALFCICKVMSQGTRNAGKGRIS